MSFDKNIFIDSLYPLQEKITEKSEQTIELIASIAEIIFYKMDFINFNPEHLQSFLYLHLFSHSANDLRKKNDLQSVINGENSLEYTALLLKVLEDNDAVLSQYNLNTHEGAQLFFQSTMTLLEFAMCGIEIDKEYLSDFLAISNILQNKSLCFKALDQFEKDLEKHAKKINPSISAKHMFKLQPIAFEKSNNEKIRIHSKQEKILSSFIKQWAINHGFNKKEYARIDAFLDPKEFFAFNLSKTITKDVGAGPGHGYFSHAIQFYIFDQVIKQYPSLLKHSAADIYEALGRNKGAAKKLFNWNGYFNQMPNYPWDILLDRVDEREYRTPYTLVKDIIENKERFPLLANCLRRHQEVDEMEIQLSDKEQLDKKDKPRFSTKSISQKQ